MRRTIPIALLSIIVGTGCPGPQSTGQHVQEATFTLGIPVIDATVNGVDTRCIVDTGNPNFALSTAFGGEVWNGLNEPDIVDVDSLVLAGWNFSGGAITHSDANFERWRERLNDPDIDCWLGYGVLGVTNLTIDYAGSRIEMAEVGEPIMRPATITDDEFVVRSVSDEFMMVGSVNVADDYDAILMFDTGSSYVTLSEASYDDLRSPPALTLIDDLNSGQLSQVGVASDHVSDVSLVVWDDPQIPLIESLVSFRVDGTVGASFLAGYAVTFNFSDSEVLFRPYQDEIRTEVLDSLHAELGF